MSYDTLTVSGQNFHSSVRLAMSPMSPLPLVEDQLLVRARGDVTGVSLVSRGHQWNSRSPAEAKYTGDLHG
jgi:hypothetical protein